MKPLDFQPGSIVSARGREWVVLPRSKGDLLYLRPMGGGEADVSLICPSIERMEVTQATFPWPDEEKCGRQVDGLLLRDALMLKLRNGAGPFRSFGNIAIEPRAYQLVPLMMALKLDIVRLLIADDVGIGKTIEAGLIAREMIDRGEIDQLTVLCPPHLCDQWQKELLNRFHIDAQVVRTSTAVRLERGIPAGHSIFTEYPFTIISLDYIKNKKRRDAFIEQCPGMVIVDEAHTCTRSGKGRQLRFEVLRDLAQDETRHLILLTATPHSGDEEAFYNLLGLLKPEFIQLKDVARTDHPLRKDLAAHFIQRRRQDIKEWQEGDLFPERFSAETTYRLTGQWGKLFEDVVDYARELVEREAAGSLKQRMNWWAALALLRCISSSPQAAIRALKTRLENTITKGMPTDESGALTSLDEKGAATVFDGTGEDLSNDDIEPGAAQDEDIERIQELIDRTRTLKAGNDPKLKQLIKSLKPVLADEFTPVIFCRYIATAQYLGRELSKKFKTHQVITVTGELTPTEREEKISGLSQDSKSAILIATDCLSEGINLQDWFTAVVHYDLTWNPTRHEQREGRVDRFGQKASVVKALMLYGEDNPVDGAVLQVIIRKAEHIKKTLGVSVSMPEDNNRISQAIMNTVLLKRGRKLNEPHTVQMDLFDSKPLEVFEENLEAQWESAREKAKKNRTIFAQNRLKPDEVMPEWEKAFAILGTNEDVQRFVLKSFEKLNAPITPASKGGFRPPIDHLPLELKERLQAENFMALKTIDFCYPPKASGAEFIHRTHPLVSHLADFISEKAMAGEETDLVSRAGAVYTKAVAGKTAVILLRLRFSLTIRRKESKREMMAEEAMALKIENGTTLSILSKQETKTLMRVPVSKNMAQERRSREISAILKNLTDLSRELENVARDRAAGLLDDHRRLRDAARARGEYTVTPQLPVDIMGVYVLVPDLALF